MKIENKNLARQNGQAVIEYILVLVVVVAIILGLASQFNTGFASWAKNYFGEYLACILETGELPSVGGGIGANYGECSEAFQPFTFTAGRPPKGDGSGRGSDGNSSNSQNQSGKSSSSSRGSGPKSYRADGSSASGGMESSRSGRFLSSRSSKGKRSSGGSSEGSASEIAMDKAGLPGWATGGKKRIKVKSGKFNNYGRVSGVGSDKKKDKEIRFQVKRKKDDGRKEAKKILVPKRKLSSTEKPDDDVGLTIGNFVKYILIIAIIIFILIYVGSQFFQVKEGMD
ncbi:MAG: hypothetical protein KDD50_05915 [Bdellovibrionales bacterium]|nr:hypothetical protein [Bdellovibrionales bacterium]